MRRTCTVIVLGLAVLCIARTSSAVFHLAVIDEVLTSYDGEANVQFIEIRMLASFQTAVAHSVLAAFDSSGAYIGDILEVPSNVATGGDGVRWLVGTDGFQSASGLAPDFIMPAGILPGGGGMVCFGGGGGIVPQNPPAWDRTNYANYVDCVAYGTYSGTSNALIGTPTPLDGDGHSLQRTTNTKDNAADFTCGDPATPENNTGASESMAATSPCQGGATPTLTPTATAVPTGTVAACVGDCDGDGVVAINELIIGVNIALDNAPVSACPAFDCRGNQMVTVDCLVRGVNNALDGCPAPPTATPTQTPSGALAVRHFSIERDTSQFVAMLAPGALPEHGVSRGSSSLQPRHLI